MDLTINLINFNEFKKQPKVLYASSVAVILALVIILLLYFQPFSFLTLSSESKYLGNYSQFKPNKKLAAAINTLPSDKKLATEKLEELQNKVSPANDARRLYILAQINQRAGKSEEAYEQYTSIKRRYIPYIADRVLLHIAETAEELGYEKAVLNSCNEIIKRYPHSLSIPAAHYEIARSLLRQSKSTEAKNKFKKIKLEYPYSQQAIGALYYLGSLSSGERERDQLWQEYLVKSPNGRFSNEIISVWLKKKSDLNKTQKSLIGLSYLQQGKAKEKTATYDLLLSEVNELTWIPIGKYQLEKKQKSNAQQTLLNGLVRYSSSIEDLDTFKDTLNLLFRNSSYKEKEGFVETLLPKYKDNEIRAAYILWRQAAFYKPGSKKNAIYNRLIGKFPDSKYSGAASAEIFWEQYKSQNYNSAKVFGYKHLKKYGQLPESAKVYFWLAKRAEAEGHKQEAKRLYSTILNNHENSYYAFRAKGRLIAINGGKDPGWSLRFNPNSYVNTSKHDDVKGHWVWQLPESEIKKLHPSIQELVALNLWQEALTLLPKNYKDEYPGLYSWILARVQEDIIKSTVIASRVLRKKDASFENNHDYWLLSHPFIYFEFVQQSANKYKIDPLLIQSLMRQESRFQHKIVSRSNAIGLCQLLPSTAREVARQIGYPKPDFDQLCIPSFNIELGTKYLSGLRDRFGENQLAIAAYNGGPGSVSKWLRQKPGMDSDMFVETIPFNETRNYVIYVFENYWVYQNLADRIYGSDQNINLSKKNNFFGFGVDYPSTVQKIQ